MLLSSKPLPPEDLFGKRISKTCPLLTLGAQKPPSQYSTHLLSLSDHINQVILSMPHLQSQQSHLSTRTVPSSLRCHPGCLLPPLCPTVVRRHSLSNDHLSSSSFPFRRWLESLEAADPERYSFHAEVRVDNPNFSKFFYCLEGKSLEPTWCLHVFSHPSVANKETGAQGYCQW